MATKKYISPDVFPVTIRDNFRKAMGQHYIVDPTGISLWNPMVKKLDQPLTIGTAPAPTQIEGKVQANRGRKANGHFGQRV